VNHFRVPLRAFTPRVRKHPASLILSFGFLAFFILDCSAQEKVLYLDKDGNRVKEKYAQIIEQRIKLDDTTWEDNLYPGRGPILASRRYSDENMSVLNGPYVNYSDLSNDTLGEYKNGQREGIWIVSSKIDKKKKLLQYQGGQLVAEGDDVQKLLTVKKGKDTSITVTFKKVEVESEFPGGNAAWIGYIGKNIRYPDRAVNLEIQGIPVIQFIVDTNGHVNPTTVTLARSIDFTLDREALRVVRNSPDWSPAQQNGRRVRSYKKQPIVFSLSRK
jgi:protein TonB